MSSAYILIDGHIISEMQYGYRRWHFVRDDRIIRTSRAGQRREHLYVTTADVFRQRLADAGYNRESLEPEFHLYTFEDKIAHFTNLPYLEDNPRQASARADAVRFGTLEDWLGALRGALRFYRDLSTRATPCYKPHEWHDPFIDMDYLIEGVTNRDFPDRPDMLPRQNRMGFPCASLECFAVAMLEVVPDNAECALDVTDLVKRGDVYCFDDLILAQQDGA